jgi:hypothetical protein
VRHLSGFEGVPDLSRAVKRRLIWEDICLIAAGAPLAFDDDQINERASRQLALQGLKDVFSRRNILHLRSHVRSDA